MSKTIDGIEGSEVQHLWVIEEEKVIDFFETSYEKLKGFKSKQQVIKLNAHLGYSTELAATQALIKDLENRMNELDMQKIKLTQKYLKLTSSEIMTIKTKQSDNSKRIKVGNITI